ncbi:MAG: helix-turn-helix domain-containing protein [Gallintestinimicrobium sp.]
MTLREYVQNVRIEKSCELLEESDLRVVEIARRVGYEDIKFFNQIFKADADIPAGIPENLHEPCSRRIKDMEQKYLKTEETNSKQEEVWNRR